MVRGVNPLSIELIYESEVLVISVKHALGSKEVSVQIANSGADPENPEREGRVPQTPPPPPPPADENFSFQDMLSIQHCCHIRDAK